MKKKKATRPRSARLMAADSRLQKESAFDLLSAEWSPTHTEEHRRLIIELVDNGHSLRCIARNLPGPPDESVVRDLKNSVKPECKQGLKKAVPTEKSTGGQAHQQARSAESTSPHPPDQRGAPEQATGLTDSTEKPDAVVPATADTLVAADKRRLSPADYLADVQKRAAKAREEQRRSEEEYRNRCAASRGNALEQLKRDPIV